MSVSNSSHPIYFISNSRRWVEPYYYIFSSSSKKRWWNESLFNIYSNEFNAFPKEYYKKAIESGKITVNKTKVNLDYIIQNNDIIEHTAHIHEPSVKSTQIQILEQTKEYLIVNKPASIPTYSVGTYHYNNVISILYNEYKEFEQYKLRPLHRLDRVVSGILVIAKSSSFASQFMSLLSKKKVEKIYIARVYGKFPTGDPIICNEPIGKKDIRNGINHIDKENGKDALTIFQFISYSSSLNQSLVLCKPKTGRPHQLRLHLQYIGYPIVNDFTYAPKHLLPEPKNQSYYPNSYIKDKICDDCSNKETGHRFNEWDEIYLHAYSYSLSEEIILSCKTPLPIWAIDDSFEEYSIETIL